MLKHIYKGGIMMALLTLAACSNDTFTEENLTPGNTPITLKGTVTRATGDSEKDKLKPLTGYNELKLSAKYNGSFYFKNQALAVGGVDTEKPNQNELDTKVRYPAGNQPINLFAHTGDVNDQGILTLESGQKAANDILLSNGTGNEEGTGTKGSSEKNVELLTFRHVMTKVEVVADYSLDTDLQEPKPEKISIKFGSMVAAQGTIYMTSKLSESTTKATVANGDKGYTLQIGDNYVVPNGVELVGKIISELIIDDYKATPEDLANLTIGNLDISANKFVLSPGFSYKLTLNIKRLKVVSITLKKVDWNIEQGNGDWGYTPYKVGMTFSGGYDNQDDAKISKVVLKHTAGGSVYQYVGGVSADGNIDFVTLPSGNIGNTDLKADLYTKNGLLVEAIEPTSYTAPSGSSAGTIGISLGANGMNKKGEYYEVTTPLQFYNMMKAPTAEKYKLINNIDMNSLPLPYESKEWISGAELDGDGKLILHLDLKGSGLVAENNGALKNIHIAPGTITSTADYTGGLCSVNNGTIEACVNETDIIAPTDKTIGGICGKNTGTILACLNTGNIQQGSNIGGICGENKNTAEGVIKGCINAGMLNKNATNLGGICGVSAETENTIVNTCYWLTGTARKIQQTDNEVAIGNGKGKTTQAADLAPEKLRGEAVTNINKVITGWVFKWEKNTDGTYPCVWPIPVKK